jgi:alkylhydroperoxidase family enzyme
MEALDPQSARQAAANAGVPAQLADLEIFRVLLHHPGLAKPLSDLLLGLLLGGKLDVRLRELVIMRVGWSTGSVYEWTQHWRIARDLGVSEADLLGTRDWQEHAGFGGAERAVLAATDETIATGTLSRETWESCRALMRSDAAMIELVAVIATWRMVSSVLRSLEVGLEQGVAPWPPDGRGPGNP